MLAKIMKALERRGFKVLNFDTGEQAADYLLSELKGLTIGFGDSETLKTLNLAKRLANKNLVIDPQAFADDGALFLKAAQRALTCDVFMTSVNAAAATGELVNLDSTGNRVAGSLFGRRKVYFIFGINKITPDLNSAIDRVRNTAAPTNAKRHKYKTPCAVTGKCEDCASPDRICNALVIYLHALKHAACEAIIINQSLGL